jgi:hypothetical protein
MHERMVALFITAVLTIGIFTAVPVFMSNAGAATIGATDPADGAAVNGTYLFRLDDAAGGATGALFYLDGFLVGSMDAVASSPSFDWQYSLNTTAWSDGPHMVRFDSTGGMGGNAVKTVSVYFVNNVPITGIMAPLAGQFVEGRLTVKVLASDGNDIDHVEISSFDSPVLNRTIAFNQMDSLYEFAFDTRILPDGEYSLRAAIFEKSAPGLPVRVELASDFMIDNNPPDLTLVAPGENEFVSGMFDIDATVVEQFPQSLRFSVDGGPASDVLDRAE